MTEYESLLDQVQNLLAEPAPDIVELRSQLLDIEDFIGAPDYAELDSDQQDALQNLRKALKARLRDLEDAQPETVEEGNVEAGSPSPTAIKDDLPPLSARKISAEEQMEEAEKFFYSGRYGEAIKLFDRVLDLEPDWERARQHRAESEEYLRTGYIPAVALPAEAATAFGKAQSAAARRTS